MFSAKVNNKKEFRIELQDGKSLKGTVDGKNFNYDLIEVRSGVFHILRENKSCTAEVLRANKEEKSFTIRVNGNKYSVRLKDKYDELLEKLGMSDSSSAKIKELKAPMPGLVIDVRVNENDTVKKGDALIVLEAMKMENVLKASADTTVKKIFVKKGNTAEKNQTLISFS